MPEFFFYISPSVCLKYCFQDYSMNLTLALRISANISVSLSSKQVLIVYIDTLFFGDYSKWTRVFIQKYKSSYVKHFLFQWMVHCNLRKATSPCISVVFL